MRLTGPIALKLLTAGSVTLLVCGIASAQTGSKSLSANPDKSAPKLWAISAHSTSRKNKKSRKSAANWRHRGQQKIDPVRSREIQEALIREHYLDGTASGVWDAKAQAAMERYQADNGWQSTTSVEQGAFGVDVRNYDGLVVLSDMRSGLWLFKMDGFNGWNGHDYGMPNISSVQDWDNGPEGAPKPQKVS